MVVDVDDESQRDRLQLIANDISNLRILKGKFIEFIHPMLMKNQEEFRKLFQLTATHGFGPKTMLTIGQLGMKLTKK